MTEEVGEGAEEGGTRTSKETGLAMGGPHTHHMVPPTPVFAKYSPTILPGKRMGAVMDGVHQGSFSHGVFRVRQGEGVRWGESRARVRAHGAVRVLQYHAPGDHEVCIKRATMGMDCVGRTVWVQEMEGGRCGRNGDDGVHAPSTLSYLATTAGRETHVVHGHDDDRVKYFNLVCS